MFITKKTHSAPDVPARAPASTLALPLLDAMVPAARLLAQTAAAPKTRFVGIFFPHGMAPGYWVPEAEGALPDKLPFILESLENGQGPDGRPERPVVEVGRAARGHDRSDHWVAAAFLTGIKPRKTAGADATVGSPTIDQLIAQKIGQETLLPSLQLAVEDPTRARATAAKATAARTRTRSRGSTCRRRRRSRCRARARCRWS